MKGMMRCCAALVASLVMSSQGSAEEWNLKVPEGGVGFNFGPAAIQGLTNVSQQTVYNDQNGYGFVSSDGLSQHGGAWPDALSGRYVTGAKAAEFRAKVPNGEYLVWLCAGKMIRANLKDRHFLLKLNDKVLCDDTPGDEDFASEKYLYRFMWTQYSERPHAMWEDYIDNMYASSVEKVTVNNGQISVSMDNHFLSALIAVPVNQKAALDTLLADIRGKRIEEFETAFAKKVDPEFQKKKKPERLAGEGDYIVYVPDEAAPRIEPSSGPTEKERKQTRITSAGTPGERVLMKLVVVPFADLGKSTLVLGDLKGPGTISAGNIRGFYKNYRFIRKFEGKYLVMGESALLPTLTLNVEKGVTEVLCLTLLVPEDAKAGMYNGTFTFKPDKGKSVDVPVQFEVYPFKLEKDLPVSYTMWQSCGYDLPFLSADMRRKILKDRLIVEREIGFTSLDVPCPLVRRAKDGKATIAIDSMPYEVAKEVGLGKRPEQGLYVANFMAGAGRTLARVLGSSGTPGAEFGNPEFKTYLKDVIAQFKQFIDKSGLPVVVCAVDEPREVNLNSWNRNYDDTCVYLDMLREGGIRAMVNPMADASRAKDYTGFVDHLDVYSSHAWERSGKSFKLAKEKGKTIWLYNSGMDRYSWGFYNWRFKSQGRMEWVFCSADGESEFGYPGLDWYNPFNGMAGFAPSAPYAKYKGGHLFQSNYSEVSMGITDYAYIYTLTETLKKLDVNKSKAAKEAADFLASLEEAMPEYSWIPGLSSGAGVGQGPNVEARWHVDEWRAKIAGYLKELKK